MKSLGLYAAAVAAVAAVSHGVVIWAAPYVATDRVIGRIQKTRDLLPNTLSVNPPASAARNAVPMGNPDTMVASAWLDLAAGPLVFDAPLPQDGRYWSLSLFAHDSDTDFIVSDRDLVGESGVRVIIVGPGDPAPSAVDGTLVARSSTRRAFLLVRAIMNDRNDPVERARVSALLSQSRLEPLT